MDFKEIILSSEYEVHCNESLEQYLSLILEDYDGDEYSEVHHILPKSMFSEFRNDKSNLVRLKYNDHIEAHRLLKNIFKTYGMKLSYILMTSVDIERKLYFLKGDLNPAKRIEVREKISESKLGKSRPDLKGKCYFGADPEKIQIGIEQMSKKLSGTVIVKNSKNERFRISVNDERYLSGELKSFNLGESRPNSYSKNPEFKDRLLNAREKTYEKFKNFSYNEMVEFLLSAHTDGKQIFPKDGSRAQFAKNYSGYCKRTSFDQKDLKASVVQRLSKG